MPHRVYASTLRCRFSEVPDIMLQQDFIHRVCSIHVCKTHQLEFGAEPAERSPGSAPHGGEAIARSDGFESHGMRFRIRSFRNPERVEQPGRALLRTQSE